ncbi:exosortase family protein XrtG [Weissella cibaria]|jgi:exosortase family protein XrtG|uniref:Exosortase family protein XrtG n=1 Tax=Weissella cibaria TaxID=137591 RepID=A0A1X4JN86_9LACO|nr:MULTISPECIES: exosortase family protein XrtG [Weissella]MCT0000583.1 exosortase family protein XrtG [Weissella cibaria]MCT0011730.1 exosortase family protein XrtG [Weissella cibaria]MCT0951732.1 exosortase family protein XrtG [Weissella cibaria]MCT8399572.1 exosortase family protein XrtG [Weissella cibaria]MDH5012481.1 exosortase family protein XrtG [Weissella cibaria]
MFWLIVLLGGAWLYVLSVLKRIGWSAAYVVLGVVGTFFIIISLANNNVISFLMRLNTSGAGVVGMLTGFYTVAPTLGIIHIVSGQSAINLFITYECSALIELAAYIALVLFFPFFKNLQQRLKLLGFGVIYLLLANMLRLTVTALIIHFLGLPSLIWAHVIVGRLIFYVLTIILYFYVFTRSQVLHIKIGRFDFKTGGA